MAFPLEDSRDWEAVWTGCVVRSVHISVADQPRLLGLSAVARRNSNKEAIMIGEVSTGADHTVRDRRCDHFHNVGSCAPDTGVCSNPAKDNGTG
jgi:hypothetical protein